MILQVARPAFFEFLVNELRFRSRRGILVLIGPVAARGRPAADQLGHLERSVVDATSLAEIWDAHADRLLLIARSIGGPAEDAVQEAFISLATQPQLPADPLGWLVRVTRNRLLEWHRGNRRRRARETAVSVADWFDDDLIRVDQKLDAREVAASLQRLTSPDREVIVMHLWGEMTFESIAEAIGGSRASAHRAFRRGLQQLKSEFNSESMRDSMRLCNEP